ncbi:cysteine--tRNA ligase [Dehalococcoidia bacterium]|nr:cysteine--tRNA ligase [Dehalococcoidia bacterium]
MVTMYTCGPTVYRYSHIGNLRSYLMADCIRRVLQSHGYTVHHVKNITDVGHMRQEVLERGEDKIIAAAIAEGKTPQEIASFYTEIFLQDEVKLNTLPAEVFPRATNHITEMVDMIKRLVERGHAYCAGGNVYFSVASFPRYGALSGNIHDDLLEGIRVEVDPSKRDPRDFTLWKAAEPGRTLKWPSPWGEGFPGWHIECSAMSIKYLGEQIDIHTGGVDNIFPHHEGEIAQSEGVTNKPFVQYWVHGQLLLADGVKMAKSAANAYTLDQLESRGFDPLAFRYLCLTTRFNARLNFTFSSLRGSQRAITRIRDMAWDWSLDPRCVQAIPETVNYWRDAFLNRTSDNLDMPGSLAVVWAMARSDLPPKSKLQLLLDFDEILGLNLGSFPEIYQVPIDVATLGKQRHELRKRRQFSQADNLRHELQKRHYIVRDGWYGTRIRAMTDLERRAEIWRPVSSSKEVESLIDLHDVVDFSFVLIACNYNYDVKRCVQSVLHWSKNHSIEIIAIDNGSVDGTSQWLEDISKKDSRLKVVHTDHILGDAAAKNIGLKQSRGRTVVLIDTSIEITGDIYPQLTQFLSKSSVGMIGPFGLRSNDMRHFQEVSVAGDVDAIQGYFVAFQRTNLKYVGLMPEVFRFYRNLDIYYSFRFKSIGLHIYATPNLPIRRHVHRIWSEMQEDERERLSHKNFRRFLKEWGSRTDLLASNTPANSDE